MSALEALLALQELDTLADQLRHRRAHLSERAELGERERELADLEAARSEMQARRDELSLAERHLEEQIEVVRAKATADDKALYGGSVSAIKDLRALQDEIESLGRRQRDLEDRELEIMEQAEPVDAELERIRSAAAAADAAASALVGAITEIEVLIDGELASVETQRAQAVLAVPAELIEEYERLRKPLGGVAVARLVGNRCDGCHLTLPAVEIDRLRHEPPDALAHCSECGRMLVR